MKIILKEIMTIVKNYMRKFANILLYVFNNLRVDLFIIR